MSLPPVNIELIAGAVKAILMIVLGLNLSLFLLYFERKGSALIQDRIGSNRVTITGFGKRMGMPNLGIINTTIADPVKMFTKEDFVPARPRHHPPPPAPVPPPLPSPLPA